MNTHGLARLHVVAMLAAVLAGSACNAGAAQSPAWAPHKIVELISPGIPGDGSENTVRLMQKIWQDQRLVETPVSAVSKPGGGHAVSLAYLRQHAGDPHYLLAVGGVTLLASHIAGI